MLALDTLRAGGDFGRDDLEDAMTNIHEAGEQVLRIASNYVLYAQLATEESPSLPVCAPVDYDDWEPRLARAVRKLAMRHGRMRDLSCDFAEAAIAIKADHLEKLISELVDNACKFSHPGQPVRVTGVVQDGRYRLTVADEGRGMTADEIESLGPMVQVDRVRVMQRGVGLGLAISRALASRCGGSLALKPNDKRGLLVEVMLPLGK